MPGGNFMVLWFAKTKEMDMVCDLLNFSFQGMVAWQINMIYARVCKMQTLSNTSKPQFSRHTVNKESQNGSLGEPSCISGAFL